MIDRKSAGEAAAEEASAEAQHDAEMIASILPCSKCLKRSRIGVASFVVRSALAITGFLALGGTFWRLMHGWLRWVLPALMVAVAVSSAKRRRSRYQLASALVLELRPEVQLPRAHVHSLPAPPVPVAQPPAAIEPTPATDEPRTLR